MAARANLRPMRRSRLLRYCKAADTAKDQDGKEIYLRYVVTYGGEKVVKLHKAFRTLRRSWFGRRREAARSSPHPRDTACPGWH